MTPPTRNFLPGPTALHPLVPGELARAISDGLGSEPHRGRRARLEIARTAEALRALLGAPDDHRIFHLGSATEAMERIAAGVMPVSSPGGAGLETRPESDRGAGTSLHLVAGAFARRFAQVGQNLNRDVTVVERPEGRGFGPELPLDALPEGFAVANVRLLALCQNETSTGARTPPAAVHALARAVRDAGGLVAVDLVTGWPTEAVDAGWIDAGFVSVQKGFGLPAGLGVLVASPALVEEARRNQEAGVPVGGWIHLPALARRADDHETAVTPNLVFIRVLGRVAEAMLAEGRDALGARMEARARLLRDAVRASPNVRPVVPDHREEERSRTILVLEGCQGQSLEAARDGLAFRGFRVGSGYRERRDTQLRIANFPGQSDADVEALAKALGEVLPGV